MGNSEVGHLTIGSGRVLFQDLMRVNVAVADGTIFENAALRAAFARARERGGDVHLLGLVSHGGVHSHIDHLRALLELARREGMGDRVWIHAFTDGRDVSPHAAAADLADAPRGADRNRRRALLRDGSRQPGRANRAGRRRDSRRRRRRGDRPRRRRGGELRRRRDRRVHRADRARRPSAPPPRDRCRDLLQLPTGSGPAALATPPRTRCRPDDDDPLRRGHRRARRVSRAGGRRHARGRRSAPPACGSSTRPRPRSTRTSRTSSTAARSRSGRERRACSCRRHATSPGYDEKPEMSAAGVADEVVSALPEGYGFCVVNFANPDMVGHTGVIPAVVSAVEAADAALGRVVDATLALGGVCLVTADHGNAEKMLEADGVSPHTAHTTNPVPLVLTAAGRGAARRTGPCRSRSDGASPARAGGSRGDDRPGSRDRRQTPTIGDISASRK